MITASLEGTATIPDLQFVELPLESFGNNTIDAPITFPPPWLGGSNLITCAVNARRVLVIFKGTRDVIKVVSGQSSDYRGHHVYNSNSSSVDVTAEWTQCLNLQVQATNKTVYICL